MRQRRTNRIDSNQLCPGPDIGRAQRGEPNGLVADRLIALRVWFHAARNLGNMRVDPGPISTRSRNPEGTYNTRAFAQYLQDRSEIALAISGPSPMYS
jgi:hypothetical protein